MDDWQDFIVHTRRIKNLTGREFTYKIPPSWKTELLLWEYFKEFSSSFTLQDYLANFEHMVAAVALILDVSPEEVENFSSEQIELIFSGAWDHIIPDVEEVGKVSAPLKQKAAEQDATMAGALAMFGVECGWLPRDVLEMPRKQVLALASNVTHYVAQKMKFQAAIHGAEIEGGAGKPDMTQIDSESYWRDLQSKGLPVEVK